MAVIVGTIITYILSWLAEAVLNWFSGVYDTMFWNGFAIEINFRNLDNFSISGLYNAIYTFAIAILALITAFWANTYAIKEKNINEQFCELYQTFTNKKKCQYEIDMLIGMHLSKQQKNYEKKYNNLIEVQNRLKKRISDLTSQLNMLKYGKKMPSDLEEHKIEIDIDNANLIDLDNKTTQITEIKRDYKCNTFQKYSEKKMRTLSRRIGDNTITTTTQISYKRRQKGGNNQ